MNDSPESPPSNVAKSGRRLKDRFTRAAVTGVQGMSMSQDERQRIVRDCLERLDNIEKSGEGAGEAAISLILQPLFALSGYKLGVEPLTKDHHAFDLIANNIVGGDDRIYVDYKYNRDGRPRTLIPGQILEMLTGLAPSDPTRAVLLTPAGFAASAATSARQTVGPRLELWSFAEVRSRLIALGATEDRQRLDLVATLMLDLVENLALAIGRAQAELRQIEWRILEHMIAYVLSELGYAVTLTRGARDGGKDVIVADFTGEGLAVYNIEIKHWTADVVGKAQVDRLLEVSVGEGRDGALLLATSGVGPAAIRARGELHTDYLRFGDEQKMVMTCRTFAQKRGGLWSGPRPFKTYVLDGTD